jgi:hypothetical protein
VSNNLQNRKDPTPVQQGDRVKHRYDYLKPRAQTGVPQNRRMYGFVTEVEGSRARVLWDTMERAAWIEMTKLEIVNGNKLHALCSSMGKPDSMREKVSGRDVHDTQQEDDELPGLQEELEAVTRRDDAEQQPAMEIHLGETCGGPGIRTRRCIIWLNGRRWEGDLILQPAGT